MIKSLTRIILFTGFIMSEALAEDFSEEVKREYHRLQRFIKNESIETEKLIILKKQEAVKALEKTERGMRDVNLKMLINIQIAKYRKEIEEAENKLNIDDRDRDLDEIPPAENEKMQELVKEASRIVDFEKSYFYTHPTEEFKDITGELKFHENGAVTCYHRRGAEVILFKKWGWYIKNKEFFINGDRYHGRIYVTKKSPRELYLDWKGRVNKKNVAKQ